MPKTLNLTTLTTSINMGVLAHQSGTRVIDGRAITQVTRNWYQSPRWKAIRTIARRTLGNRCCKCNEAGGLILVDHVANAQQLNLIPQAKWTHHLQVLCQSCHNKKVVEEKKALRNKQSINLDYRNDEQKLAMNRLSQSVEWRKIMSLPDTPGASVVTETTKTKEIALWC